LDKGVRVGAGALVGDGEDNTPNQQSPDLLNTGPTLVRRGAELPAGATIGRNVVIRPRVGSKTFDKTLAVPSGRTVGG
ncbi:MAG: glucose-1-phosphate adenylyltransferase, partial [Roseiflexaceae bacterium]|nr:glucose-1-phosphate adenylyltransferase [Roseiflexaceae bacterium]